MGELGIIVGSAASPAAPPASFLRKQESSKGRNPTIPTHKRLFYKRVWGHNNPKTLPDVIKQANSNRTKPIKQAVCQAVCNRGYRGVKQVGDETNILMTACAWNLRKWLMGASIHIFVASAVFGFLFGIFGLNKCVFAHFSVKNP